MLRLAYHSHIGDQDIYHISSSTSETFLGTHIPFHLPPPIHPMTTDTGRTQRQPNQYYSVLLSSEDHTMDSWLGSIPVGWHLHETTTKGTFNSPRILATETGTHFLKMDQLQQRKHTGCHKATARDCVHLAPSILSTAQVCDFLKAWETPYYRWPHKTGLLWTIVTLEFT